MGKLDNSQFVGMGCDVGQILEAKRLQKEKERVDENGTETIEVETDKVKKAVEENVGSINGDPNSKFNSYN